MALYRDLEADLRRVVADSTVVVTGASSGIGEATARMLGAAGAVEAIASVLSIVHGVVPPTINVTELDPDCDLCYAIGKPVTREVRVALSNAFGFGGHNTCAAFKAYEE